MQARALAGALLEDVRGERDDTPVEMPAKAVRAMAALLDLLAEAVETAAGEAA